MSESGNSPVTDKPWRFKQGQSGNPSGRPKGMAGAAVLIQREAARIAKARHPKADEVSAAVGYPVRTRLQVLLLQLAKDDPRTFLAYLGGKPVESVDLVTNTLPPVITVRFGNDNGDSSPQSPPPPV